VTELNKAGAVQSGSGFTASLNAPSAIAIDPLGSPWITNKGNDTVSRLTSSGGGLSAPAGIAFGNDGNAWIANSGSPSITLINSSGTNLTNYGGSGIAGPVGIAITPH
jgi:streptogramin lyase